MSKRALWTKRESICTFEAVVVVYHLFVNLPTAFSGMTVTFCRRSWRSCERPSSSCGRYPCHRCAPALEEVWVFLGSFWPERENQKRNEHRTRPDKRSKHQPGIDLFNKFWIIGLRARIRLITGKALIVHILWAQNLIKVPYDCLKVLDCYQPLKGPSRWNNQDLFCALWWLNHTLHGAWFT